MTTLTALKSVRNYSQILDMSDFVVETDLFPRDVLDAYTAWNLEQEITPTQQAHFDSERGGGQGDYRAGMSAKIDNVVDCLTRFPASKRAVVTISNNPAARHEDDDDAKCLRELHLYLDGQGRLAGTVLFRAQAALIFPKNIHFIGSLMETVAERLPGQPELGVLYYLTTLLVSDRS